MIWLAALALSALGNPDPLTIDTARSLSPQELERRIYQAERGTTREVAVHDFSRNMYRASQRADFGVELADAPKPTALRGLCSVQVRTAVFGRGYAPDAGERAPTHLIELSEQTRYAVQPSELSLSTNGPAACVPTPVIDNSRYFEVTGIWERTPNPDAVIRAIRAINSMMRDGTDKRLSPVACTEDLFAAFGGTWTPLCADAGQSIASLRWEEISRLNVQQCAGKLCISAYFRRPLAPRDASRLVELKAEIGGRDEGDIGSISLLGVTAID